MSTSTPDPPRTVTWRDAVTPLSRASRRRWTLCYALLLAALAACVVDDTIGIERQVGGIPTILIVGPLVVFGMLRRGTRRITALDHPDLDERDVAARDSAYRIAFPLLVLATLAGLILLGQGLPDIAHSTHLPPPDQHYVQTRHGWFLQSDELLALGAWIALWAVFLPTGVLAWREPDAIEPETSPGGLPEPLRDALLGLALVGAVAAALIAEVDAAVLAFVAALALLGALGRRASGQPVMSRQRLWRVAIGIAIILAVVVVGTVVSAGGSR
ncbi:MAG TPA: hypothetical protein VGO80_08305 [Solirubrobacteraceae bacterium]|jgi:hypothetical protein|nr:hypothetical protein [Solirubrobacteraceae bacterium]